MNALPPLGKADMTPLEIELPEWAPSWPCDLCSREFVDKGGYAWRGRSVCGSCLQATDVDPGNLEERLQRPSRSGHSLMPFQRTGATWLAERRLALLQDAMGTGKQQPTDTPVLTPGGWRQIGDLRVGDYVIGSDGRPTEVLGVFPQGVQPCYRVSFSDGSSTEAGPEHLWSLDYRCGGKRWVRLVLTTEQLRTRPKIKPSALRGPGNGPLSLARTTLRLPMLSSPVQFQPCGSLPLPAYTVGALIANGGLSHDGKKLVYNKKDWPELAWRVTGVDIGNIRTYGNATHIPLRGLSQWLRQHGLDVLSRHKRIPRAYLTAATVDRVALLQALMDADGSVSKTGNKLSYSTISAGLAADVRELVEGLGGISSIRRYDRSPEGKPVEFQVRLRLPAWVNPFSLARKASRYKPGRLARPCRNVTSVEYVRDAESVCIRVAAQDSLYVTEHCILTHNTVQVLRAVPEQYGLTVVCPKSLLLNWRNEALEWRPELVQIDRKPHSSWWSQFGPGFMGKISYEQLRNLDGIRASSAPSVLVLDEAQRAKDPTNATTQAVRELRDVVLRNGGRVWLLTATPLLNHKEELWHVWQNAYLGRVAFSGWHEFDQFFGGASAYQKQKRDRKVLEDLRPEWRERLGRIRLRRTKKEVLPELPPKKIEVIRCELTPEDAAIIHEQAKRLVAYQHAWENARNGVLPDPHEKGVKLTREDRRRRMEALRQHAEGLFLTLKEPTAQEIQKAVDDALAWRDTSPGFELLSKIRASLATAKIRALLQVVERYEDAEEPLVVFSHHRKPIEVVGSRSGWRQIEGEVSIQKRQEVIDDFQGGRLKGVGLTIKAGGVGITLTRSCNVVFVDLDWTPANNAQAEDRVNRIGQTRECTITRLVADHVVDQRVQEVLAEKIALIESVDGEDV